MKLNCLVINARNVSYEKDNRKVEGVSFQYIDDLKPIAEDQSKGYAISSGWIPKNQWNMFTVVPAFYDINFDTRIDFRGNRSLVPVAVEFTSEV